MLCTTATNTCVFTRLFQARAEDDRGRRVHIRRDGRRHSDLEGRRYGRRRARPAVSGHVGRM